MIPMAECRKGGVYKIRSRNLSIGVYAGEGGFIGIRQKLGARYLFVEFHHEVDRRYGTVLPDDFLGMLPEGIELRTHVPTVDKATNRLVDFDRPIAEGGRGWYFMDTGEANEDIHPIAYTYKPLFDYLDALEKTA